MYRHIHLCSNAEAVLTTIIITTISYSRRAFSAEQGPTRVQFYFVAAIYTSHVLKESKISHCVPLAHLAHMFQQAHFISFLKVLRFVDYISRKGRCIGCMSHKNSFWMLEPRHFFLVARGAVIGCVVSHQYWTLRVSTREPQLLEFPPVGLAKSPKWQNILACLLLTGNLHQCLWRVCRQNVQRMPTMKSRWISFECALQVSCPKLVSTAFWMNLNFLHNE